jgi:hypothetical protein
MVDCALRLVKETRATAGGDEHPVLVGKLVADATFDGSDHAPESGFIGAEEGGCLAGGGVPGGCGHAPEPVLPLAADGGDDVRVRGLIARYRPLVLMSSSMPDRRRVSLAAVKTLAPSGIRSWMRVRAAAASSRISTVNPCDLSAGGRPFQALRGRRVGERGCWNRGSHGVSWAGDEVWRVDRPPAGLGGLDELERHGDSGGAGAEAFRDPLAEPDGGEGGLETVASTLSTRTLRMW